MWSANWIRNGREERGPNGRRRRAHHAKRQQLMCERLESRCLLAALFPQFVDPHPADGNQFGHSVVPLSTGNVVITAPFDDAGGLNAGAVYLFNGATGALISALKGSHPDDSVGSGGVTALATGNFVVSSPDWDNGAITDAGAATFGNGTTGIAGVVSGANSLVGISTGDAIGSGSSESGIVPLTNGNYVVSSPFWNRGGVPDAGAVTFGNGNTGVHGNVGYANSLIGTTASDRVGISGVTPLTNGNYVVSAFSWHNGTAEDAGAVTFGNGTAGIHGFVSATNSLVGTQANDQIGGNGVTPLTNGNYVVASQNWDRGAVVDAGAVTFGNGTTGIYGAVSIANSLVGAQAGDAISSGGPAGPGVTALINGNYVVSSPEWSDGEMLFVGAVTFGDGQVGIKGVVSPANSLLGSSAYDRIGDAVTPLANGNYVVTSTSWRNGNLSRAGAGTFSDGTSGITGRVSSANSLVGSSIDDQVGRATALSNGNYVVTNMWWDNGAIADVGAATFGDGAHGITGVVSPANSLIGGNAGDKVAWGATALTNGNYVVLSPAWDKWDVQEVGAVTFGNGTTGISGTVSPTNSLTGSQSLDHVGIGGVTPLAYGNYVVRSFEWDNGTVYNAGAATFGSGTTGITGVVSPTNSLVGSSAGDLIGESPALDVSPVTVLKNGNYVIVSPWWHNGGLYQAGAATFGLRAGGVTGPVTSANSAIGTTAETGLQPAVADDVNATFYAAFPTEGGGVVRVGSQYNGFQPAPVIGNFGGAISYTENRAAVPISSTATISDVDSPNFSQGELRINFQTGGTADDRLWIRTQGTSAGQINVQGSQVRIGTIVLGTFSGGVGTIPLGFKLNAQATPFRVQQLLRNILFRNLSDNPNTTTRTVRATLSDSEGYVSNPVFKQIKLIAVNDAPVLSLSGTIGYVHDTSPVLLAPWGTVTDIDSADFAGGRLRVRITDGASTSNRLAIGAGFTVDANNNVLQGSTIIGKRVSSGFGTSELIVTFNTNTTQAIVQQLVRAITFKTVSGTAGQRKVIFTVSDGDGGLSNEATKFVKVS
jgi:hypothetical protein